MNTLISRGDYKSVTNTTSHINSGCSPSCPACCGDMDGHKAFLNISYDTRTVDNSKIRTEIFNRLAHLRLDRNTANETIENVDSKNEGYEIVRELGKGAYSVVKEAKVSAEKLRDNHIIRHFCKKTEQDRVAVKIVVREGGHKITKRFIEGECKALYRCKGHPNIVTVLDTFETTTHLYIVMELCPGGDLIDYITKHSEEGLGVNEVKARDIFSQLLSALQHCHAVGVAHRDLKCDNILLNEDQTTLKLADFGFACNLANRRSLTSTPCGSHSYGAPEVQQKERYDPVQADIWGCGAILYCLTNGNVSYYNVRVCQMQDAMKMQRLHFRGKCSPDVKHLIRRILQFDPNKRPRLHEIMNDPWVLGCKVRSHELSPRKPKVPESITNTSNFPEPFRIPTPNKNIQRLKYSQVNFGSSLFPSIIQLKSRLPNKERDRCLKTNFYKRQQATSEETARNLSPPMNQVLQQIVNGSTKGTETNPGLKTNNWNNLAQGLRQIEETLSAAKHKTKTKKKVKFQKIFRPGSYATLTQQLCQQYNIANGPIVRPESRLSNNVTPKPISEQRIVEDVENEENNFVGDRNYEATEIIRSVSEEHVSQQMASWREGTEMEHTIESTTYACNETKSESDVLSNTGSYSTLCHAMEKLYVDTYSDRLQLYQDLVQQRTGNINQLEASGIVSPEKEKSREKGHEGIEQRENRKSKRKKHQYDNHSSNTKKERHKKTQVPENGDSENNCKKLRNNLEQEKTIAVEYERNKNFTDDQKQSRFEEALSQLEKPEISDKVCKQANSYDDIAISIPSSESLDTVATPGDSPQPPTLQSVPSPASRRHSGVRLKTGTTVKQSLKVQSLRTKKRLLSEPDVLWSSSAMTPRSSKLRACVARYYQRQRSYTPEAARKEGMSPIPLQLTRLSIDSREGDFKNPLVMKKWNKPRVIKSKPSTTSERSGTAKAQLYNQRLPVVVGRKPLSDRDAPSPPANSCTSDLSDDVAKGAAWYQSTWRLSKIPTIVERVNTACHKPEPPEVFPKIRNLKFGTNGNTTTTSEIQKRELYVTMPTDSDDYCSSFNMDFNQDYM